MSSINSSAQNSKADGWQRHAEGQMEKMLYEEAVKSYEKAVKGDETYPTYKYGLAMAHYRLKNYSKVIDLIQPIVTEGATESNYYRILANSYDLFGNYEMALTTLDQGLIQLPKAAELFFDKGVIEIERKNLGKCIEAVEKGIKLDPTYADNYYLATIAYSQTNEKLWALIYGELFLNIERGTERFDEISLLVYDTYLKFLEDPTPENKEGFLIERETNNGFADAQFRLYDLLKRNDMLSPKRAFTVDGIENKTLFLGRVRNSFIELWLQGFTLAYPNTLYSMHKEMYTLGFMEAYSFWLFSKANTEEFMRWMASDTNKGKYDAFIGWFLSNPLKVDIVDHLVRTDFER